MALKKIVKPTKPKKTDSYAKFVKYAVDLEAYNVAVTEKGRQNAVKDAILKGNLDEAKKIAKTKTGELVSAKKSQY